MKKNKSKPLLYIFSAVIAVIILIIVLLNHPALQTEEQRLQAQLIEVPRISVADAKLALDAGEAIAVDVRSRAIYEMEHIPGAISAPLISESTFSLEAPPDALLYLYCT